jgi:hypothetical protein
MAFVMELQCVFYEVGTLNLYILRIQISEDLNIALNYITSHQHNVITSVMNSINGLSVPCLAQIKFM